jgi:hypothetical protein
MLAEGELADEIDSRSVSDLGPENVEPYEKVRPLWTELLNDVAQSEITSSDDVRRQTRELNNVHVSIRQLLWTSIVQRKPDLTEEVSTLESKRYHLLISLYEAARKDMGSE